MLQNKAPAESKERLDESYGPLDALKDKEERRERKEECDPDPDGSLTAPELVGRIHRFDPITWKTEDGEEQTCTLMNMNTDLGDGRFRTELRAQNKGSLKGSSWFELLTARELAGRQNELHKRLVHQRLAQSNVETPEELSGIELSIQMEMDMEMFARTAVTISDKVSRAVFPKHIRDCLGRASIYFTYVRQPTVVFITKDSHLFKREWCNEIYRILIEDSPTQLALRVWEWWVSDDRDAINERTEVCEGAWGWIHDRDKIKAPNMSAGQTEHLIAEVTNRLNTLRQDLPDGPKLESVESMSSWDAFTIRNLTAISARLPRSNDRICKFNNWFKETAVQRWTQWTGRQPSLTTDDGKEIVRVTWAEILKSYLSFHGTPTIPIARAIARLICEEVRVSKAPALVSPIQLSLQRALFSSKQTLSESPNASGDYDLYDRRQELVARVTPRKKFGAEISKDLLVDLELKLKKARSVASHELLRYLIRTAYEQLAVGMRSPDTIEVVGGMSALVKSCGLSGATKKYTTEFRHILDLFESITIHEGNNEFRGLIWVNHVQHHGPGQQSIFKIKLNDNLLANYESKELRKGHPGRSLIPLALAPPPLHGRKNEWSNQYSLQNLVISEFRTEAAELAETGSVEINDLRWVELGDEAELTKSRTLDVRDLWVSGSNEQVRPPMVKAPSTDRYTLNEAVHGTELNMIMSAGMTSNTASRRARRKRS